MDRFILSIASFLQWLFGLFTFNKAQGCGLMSQYWKAYADCKNPLK